jgi:hypothetical protein
MTLTFLLTDIEARPACGRKSTTRRWREADFLEPDRARSPLRARDDPSQGDTEDRGPPGDGTRLPSRNESLSTPLGVLQVCPTCSPDHCSRPCGLIRTARPSRSDRERSRVATCSRWCAGWPPRCATPTWARAKALDAAGNAEAAAGSAHQHGVDPVSAALLAIDGVVARAVVVLLLRQPPPQPSRPPSWPSRATGYRHDRTLAGDRRAHRHARRRYDDWVPTLAGGLACAATTSLARRLGSARAGPVADHGGGHLAPEAMAAYGESLAILERVVVAPAVGRFYPTEPAGREAGSGTRIQCGQAIGQVASQRVSTPVCIPSRAASWGCWP